MPIHPKGEHVTEAQAKIEQLMWQEAVSGKSLHFYQRYLESCPNGKHVTESHAKIEALDWLQASSANTIKSYQGHVDKYPESRFAEQAKSKQKLLCADDGIYAEVQKTGTEQALIRFLEEYPGHKRESDARVALTEIRDGRDIFALIDEGRVSLEAQGRAIHSVQVRIHSLDMYPIVLRIPAGTFFESVDASKQNMIATAHSPHKLPGGGSITVIVLVACANQFRQIPRKGSGFEIRPNSGQDDLDRFMQVLSEADVDYAVKQAVVWIVTNNPSFKGLGRLTRGFGGSGPSVIKADDAAMAIKPCYDVGIPVTQKAIWRDRGTIAGDVKDPLLSSWLRERRAPYMPELSENGQQMLVPGRERGTIQQDIPVRPDERGPEAFRADRLSVFVSSSKLYELTRYDKDYGPINTYHWLNEDFERYLYSTPLESGWDCVYSSDAADVTLRVTSTKNSRSMRSLTEQRQYNLLTNLSVFEAGQSQKEKAIFSKSIRASSRWDVSVELCRSDTIGQWRQAYESADMMNQIIEALNRASRAQTGP